jgi:Kef-type K+ transport system membrane component KefB
MNLLFLPDWPLQFNDLGRIALVLIIAGLAGEAAARLARLPRVCGYSLIGLVFGPSLFGWIGGQDADSFRIIIDLALALLLFELGARVDLRWFRANPWIIAASLAEAALTFACTFTVLWLMDASPGFAAAVAAIVIGTSPAVVMRVATELRAEGHVTQRLMVHAALNVLYSIVLSKLIVGGMHGAFRSDWLAAVLHPVYLLGGSVLIGYVVARAFHLLRGQFDLSEDQGVAILLGLLLLTLAVLQALALPTMLAPLLAGVLARNRDRRPLLWPRHFGTAGGVMVILLFVLTGAYLTTSALATGGLIALVLIGVRIIAKTGGIAMFANVSGLSWRQSLALGIALLPMSGVAFVLADDIRGLYPEFGAQVGAVVLSMVAILELAGPIAVQWALRASHETHEKEPS